jgi:hypothetical protein
MWKGQGDAPPLLQVFTPSVVAADRPGLRLFVGGLTLVGLAVGGAIVMASLMTLLGALFGIYLLLTQVLGLKLDVDPRSFVEEARRYAASN